MNSPRPPVPFIADSPGIDFLNSRAHPSGQAVEWLANGEDLIAWLEQAQIVEKQAATQLRAMAAPGELDNIAAQARDLREWFRAFVDRHQGIPLPDSALKELTPLNALLERDEAYRFIELRPTSHADEPAMDAGSRVFERVSKRHWRSPASLLLPIADALADVVCSAEFMHVKHCEGHGCTLQFLDKTKGRKRRWCSMAVCGNRAKQAAHRERAKREH